MNTCPKCSRTWTGLAVAHCAASCHKTFSTVGNFDRHRDHKTNRCLLPGDVGLVRREDGVWAMPGPEEKVVYG